MKVIGGMAFGLLLSAVHAWALGWMWLWFVVPLGVQNISFLHAWGLCTLAGMVLIGTYRIEGDMERAVMHSITRALTVLLSLGIAWIIHWAMTT